MQLLSFSVANDFYEAGETVKRELIQNSEFWFGVHQEEQVAALHKILNLIENITFGGYLKPFMKGIIASTLDLKRKGSGLICTYNLNQDILELFFMNIRSLGCSSDHPRANNFGSRFRILMLSRNCTKVLINHANVAPLIMMMSRIGRCSF